MSIGIETDNLQDHLKLLSGRVRGRDPFIEGVRPRTFGAMWKLVARAASAIRASLADESQAVALISRDPFAVSVVAFAALYCDRPVVVLNPEFSDDALLRHLQEFDVGLVIGDDEVLLRDAIASKGWPTASALSPQWFRGGRAQSFERLFKGRSVGTDGTPVDLDRQNLWFGYSEYAQIGFSLQNMHAIVEAVAEAFAIEPQSCVGTDTNVFEPHGFYLGPAISFFVGASWLPNEAALAERLPSYLGAIDRWQINQYFMTEESAAACYHAPKLFDDSFTTGNLKTVSILSDPLTGNSAVDQFSNKFQCSAARATIVPALGGIAFLSRRETAEDEADLGAPIGCEIAVVDRNFKPVPDGAVGQILAGGRRLGTVRTIGSDESSVDVADNRLLTDFIGFRAPSGHFQLSERSAIESVSEIGSDVAHAVYECAAEIFKVDIGVLSPTSDGENTDGWTSLTSVELILLLEERLSLAFTPREIMNMITLRNVIEACEKKKGE